MYIVHMIGANAQPLSERFVGSQALFAPHPLAKVSLNFDGLFEHHIFGAS